MSDERTYTQAEVDNIRTEERFISYLVLSSAGVKLQQQPAQYREARFRVADIVAKSDKYDDGIKEKFGIVLLLMDNCTPTQDQPKTYLDAYNTVIRDIIAAPKEQ